MSTKFNAATKLSTAGSFAMISEREYLADKDNFTEICALIWDLVNGNPVARNSQVIQSTCSC